MFLKEKTPLPAAWIVSGKERQQKGQNFQRYHYITWRFGGYSGGGRRRGLDCHDKQQHRSKTRLEKHGGRVSAVEKRIEKQLTQLLSRFQMLLRDHRAHIFHCLTVVSSLRPITKKKNIRKGGPGPLRLPSGNAPGYVQKCMLGRFIFFIIDITKCPH